MQGEGLNVGGSGGVECGWVWTSQTRDLRNSNSGHPQREGTNLAVFVPVWLVLSRCEATNLDVFDLCHFALLKRGCANPGGFGAH